MIRYLFATEKEAEDFYNAAIGKLPKGNIEVTGVGAHEMPFHDEEDVLVNIGYCRSNNVISGMIIEPSYVLSANTGEIIRITPVFPVESRLCVTCDRLESETMRNCYAIYDTELFNIAEDHRGKVHALKIVEGNLNWKGRPDINEAEQWSKVIKLVRQCIKE